MVFSNWLGQFALAKRLLYDSEEPSSSLSHGQLGSGEVTFSVIAGSE
jgi:hypothetical protein